MTAAALCDMGTPGFIPDLDWNGLELDTLHTDPQPAQVNVIPKFHMLQGNAVSKVSPLAGNMAIDVLKVQGNTITSAL